MTLRELRQDLDNFKIDFQRFEKEQNHNHSNLKRTQERDQQRYDEELQRFTPLEDFRDLARDDLGAIAARLGSLEEGLRVANEEFGLKVELEAVKEGLDALAQQHADLADHINEEHGKRIAEAEDKIVSLEEFRASSEEAVNSAMALVEEVRGTSEQISAAVADLERRQSTSEAGLGQQRSALAHHNDKVTAQLEALSDSLKLLATKADQATVHELHTAVSRIAQEQKAKEQSVLFGARCLSCNREFEDTVKTAGAVDLYGEKQKAQLFAQVQKSLHAPRGDADDIKLLTVKVGRTGRRVGSGTVYEGRDPVFGCAVEDVHMVPTTKGGEKEKGKSPRPRRPRGLDNTGTNFTENPPPTPPHSARQKALAATEVEQPRSSAFLFGTKEGPLDFRTPLSMLVGRGGSERQDVQAARAINRGKLAPTPESPHRGQGSPGPNVW